MELRQVYYVLEVARYQSFSKAASALYITQPAISQQISALEEELSVKLFKRDTHRVALTPEGEKFCVYGKAVVEAMDRLMEAFHQNTARDKAVIRVGVFPFYKSAGLVPVVNGFFSANHNVIGSIKVVENYTAYQLLENDELDFAIIKSRREYIRPGIKYEPLLSENLNVLVNKQNPWADQDFVKAEELGAFPLLTGEKDSHFYHEMKAFYEKYHVNFRLAFLNTLETEMMLEMVESGVGIGLVTDSVGRNCEGETIAAIPITPVQEILTFLAYPKRRRLSGAHLAFKNYIVDFYR